MATKASRLALAAASKIDSSGNVEADTLDGIDSLSFTRSDQGDILSGPVEIISDSGANALKVRARSSDDYSFIQFKSNDGNTLRGQIYSNSSGAIGFTTGTDSSAGNDLYIADGGNVGIGTSTPGNLLYVNGDTRLGGGQDYGSTTILSVAPGTVTFDAPGVAGGRLIIDGSTGYVGIGASNPGSKLSVSHSGGDVAHIASDNPSDVTSGRIIHVRDNYASGTQDSYGSIGWTSGPGQDVYIGKRTTASTGYMGLKNSSGSELLTVNMHTGSAGINNADPKRALDINHINGNYQGISLHKPTVSRSFYNAFSMLTGAGSLVYAHIKSNITMTYTMFRADFNGYNYGTSSPINTSCGGYAHAPNNNIIAAYSQNWHGTATADMYVSADGYCVFRIYVGSSAYYAGFHMDIYFEQPTGQDFDFQVLDSAWSASSSYF